jgi:hypothetical protein
MVLGQDENHAFGYLNPRKVISQETAAGQDKQQEAQSKLFKYRIDING